jgi:hypothetical protein
MPQRRASGSVSDAILAYMKHEQGAVSVSQIRAAVNASLGEEVAPSSVRSYLAENVPRLFERVAPGHYQLRDRS